MKLLAKKYNGLSIKQLYERDKYFTALLAIYGSQQVKERVNRYMEHLQRREAMKDRNIDQEAYEKSKNEPVEINKGALKDEQGKVIYEQGPTVIDGKKYYIEGDEIFEV